MNEATEKTEQVPPPPPEEKRDLEAELNAARKRIDELARAIQAGEKDRQEFKQRMERERERMVDLEIGKVALMVIEAIDQLDLSLAAADDSPLTQGVKLVRENLLKKIEGEGVTRIALEGTPYDANLAEAVDVDVTPDANEDGRVTAVVRAGYAYKNRVIRPARVKVARYVKSAEA